MRRLRVADATLPQPRDHFIGLRALRRASMIAGDLLFFQRCAHRDAAANGNCDRPLPDLELTLLYGNLVVTGRQLECRWRACRVLAINDNVGAVRSRGERHGSRLNARASLGAPRSRGTDSESTRQGDLPIAVYVCDNVSTL